MNILEKYQELRKIKYSLGREDINREYIKRYEGYGTYCTDLEITFSNRDGIKDYKNKKKLFVVNHRELHLLQIKIRKNSFEISKSINKLKKNITWNLMQSIIIDEVLSTNEIEGVKSKRKEIEEGYENKNARFYGMITLYKDILTGNFKKIEIVEDFSDLYNKIIGKELKKEDEIDGELFRDDTVYIKDNYDKIVHTGVSGESNIIEKLKKLIVFLNDENVPSLIKIIVGHYYFEYIHPFYDGNGRLGRYIMCMYLSKELDEFTAVSLSTMVNKNINEYYSGFKTVSEKDNMGECTFFVENILKIINIGQENFMDRLKEIEYKSLKSYEWIRTEIGNGNITEKESKVLTMFFQNYIIDRNKKGVLLKDISNSLDISRYICDRQVEDLFEKGYIEKTKEKPKMYRLKNNYEYVWE